MLSLAILTVYCHLQRYKSYNCWLSCLLILAKIFPRMQLLCLCWLITHRLWVMSLQSFDAAKLTAKSITWLRMKKQGACKCARMSSSRLNIYILMWVTVSCGPENKYDTRWGVSWVSSVTWFCRVSHYAVNKEKAASVSLSSHSVSGNDAKFRAMF